MSNSYATQVALHPGSDPAVIAVAIGAEVRRAGSVTITVRAEERLSDELISAAVEASSSSANVLLCVLGYAGDPDTKAFGSVLLGPTRQHQRALIDQVRVPRRLRRFAIADYPIFVSSEVVARLSG